MSNNVVIATYSKGRISLNSKVRETYDIKEGDIFIVDLNKDKLTFTKIDKKDLEKLK